MTQSLTRGSTPLATGGPLCDEPSEEQPLSPRQFGEGVRNRPCGHSVKRRSVKGHWIPSANVDGPGVRPTVCRGNRRLPLGPGPYNPDH
jgi:hypothetical protein